MRRPTITIFFASLALTACSRSETDKADIQGGPDQTGTHAMASNVELPTFLRLYPGARVEHTLGGVSSSSAGANKGGMVVFHTADAPEKIAAFYRDRLDGSGLGERSDANFNGVIMLTAAATEDADRGVQVSIAPAEEGGSRVTLVYSQDGA